MGNMDCFWADITFGVTVLLVKPVVHLIGLPPSSNITS